MLLQLERASIHPNDPAELGFVFVGAGYAGVEALAELHDMAQAALRSYPGLRRPAAVGARRRRTEDPSGDPTTPRGVRVTSPGSSRDRDPCQYDAESYDGQEAVLADGTRIPARTLVWTAGVRANPLLAQLGLPLDERGRVVVDDTLRVEGSDDVWALGDCAAVQNRKTPGITDPPTCQHALRQSRRLAKNLTGERKPYGYRMLGQVATLGRFKGIAELPGLHLWGFPGWFVTRTYHLYQLPLLTRKLRVVVDWTVALFFRRDIVELSMLGHAKKLGD